jgi:hypothetical protein
LREKVKEMPFIYRGLEGDIINDFVDPDLRGIDIDSLVLSRQQIGNIDERIRDRRRILVLGNAGIGKTTFLRHEILLLLEKNRRLPRYFEKENLLPFYLPLKALDNSGPMPILKYLLSNNVYLQKNGLKRLTALAQRRELFLFLDGYDEIQVGAGGSTHSAQNFLIAELDLLFQSHAMGDAAPFPAEYHAFYQAARSCRIWISSRREFFLLNPIQLQDESTRRGVKEAFAVHLAGIGSNRQQLANKIFQKYRDRSERYEDILDAEYFLQEIDRSPDSELIDFSYNPLFLTVMAYLYVERAIASGSHNVKLEDSINGLITECTSLLLIDLDKEKARALPTAHREALRRRRGDYVEEKRDFLAYFSCRLLYEERNVFDLAYIREKALHYFRDEHRGPNNQVILRELKAPVSSGPDVVTQLIYAGLFVLVDRTAGGESTYDFPHRRFREVLAAQYFDKLGDPSATVKKLIERQDLAETLYVFFKISRHKDEIARLILSHAWGSRETRPGSILLNCLRQANARHFASPPLLDFILRAMRENVIFVLPIEILGEIEDVSGLTAGATERLLPAFIAGQINTAALGCSLLLQLDRDLLLRELIKGVDARPKDDLIKHLIYSFLWDADREYCIEHASDLTIENSMVGEFCHAIAGKIRQAKDREDLCRRMVEALPPGRDVAFLMALDAIEDTIMRNLVDRRLLSPQLERQVALAQFVKRAGGDCYIVTHDDLDQLTAKLAKPFRPRIGKVLTQDDMDKLTEGKPEYSELVNSTRVTDSMWGLAPDVQKIDTKCSSLIPVFFFRREGANNKRKGPALSRAYLTTDH